MLIPNIRDLTNVQWKILDSLIPEPSPRRDGRGRPWKDRRAVLNGVLWVLRTALHGQMCLTVTLLIKPVIGGFSNGFAPALMKGILEALALELKTRG